VAISDWPMGERPRERLLSAGPSSLSDAELLAIILRTGVRGCSAVDLARALIQHHGGLAGLLRSHTQRTPTVRGLGPAKRAQLAAIVELARRAIGETLQQQEVLNAPQAVRDYLRLWLGGVEHECFVVLFLDAQHRIKDSETLFRGTLTQTSVYPREVVKAALQRNAAAVIFAHNHPSGNVTPSHADQVLTQTLKQALALIEVRVLDHFIVAGNHTQSFAESGLL